MNSFLALKEFGPIIGLTVILILFLIWFIKWVLKENKDREETYQSIINNHISSNTKSLEHLIKDLTAHEKISSEAQKYQREEHNKQIENLTTMVTILKSIDRRMNGNG